MFLNFYYKENKYAVIICDVPQYKYVKKIRYDVKNYCEDDITIDNDGYKIKNFKYFILIIDISKLINSNDKKLKFKLITLMRFWGYSTQTQEKHVVTTGASQWIDEGNCPDDITDEDHLDYYTRCYGYTNVYPMTAKDKKLKRHIGNIFKDIDITIKVIDNVK
jgi:hypothetical protein